MKITDKIKALVSFLSYKYNKGRSGQVDVALLYSSLQVGYCNG